jgi:hypothetical protein
LFEPGEGVIPVACSMVFVKLSDKVNSGSSYSFFGFLGFSSFGLRKGARKKENGKTSSKKKRRNIHQAFLYHNQWSEM